MAHIKNSQINPDIRKYGLIARRLINFHNPDNFLRANLLTNKLFKNRFPKDLNIETKYIKRIDGTSMRLLIVRPKNLKPLATGVLWLHGGGYAVGLPELSLHYARNIQKISNSIVVFPDYYLSTEKPYPAAIEDAYLALKWLNNNAIKLGINPKQLFVAGESAGGGLTAALSLYARDKQEIDIAFQMPLFPMLDDRQTNSSKNNNAPIWDEKSNINAWLLYLKGNYRSPKLSPYAAPARETDYHNLPPTYSFVGTIEPFYDETLTYIKNLRKAGVHTRLDIYTGAFHAFDLLGTHTQLSKLAINNWQRAFKYATDHFYSD